MLILVEYGNSFYVRLKIIYVSGVLCLIYYSFCCLFGFWIRDIGMVWVIVDWGEIGRVIIWGCIVFKIWNVLVVNKFFVFKGVVCVVVRFFCKVVVGNVFEVVMVIVILGCVFWYLGCWVVCCVIVVCCVLCFCCCVCCGVVCWSCVCCCGWVVDEWICCIGWIWWIIWRMIKK